MFRNYPKIEHIKKNVAIVIESLQNKLQIVLNLFQFYLTVNLAVIGFNLSFIGSKIKDKPIIFVSILLAVISIIMVLISYEIVLRFNLRRGHQAVTDEDELAVLIYERIRQLQFIKTLLAIALVINILIVIYCFLF
jgi:hypothetical protein